MRLMTVLAFLTSAPVVMADAALHDHAGLQVSNAWVRASLPGQTVASAFATLKNPLDKPLVLKSLHSKAAETVELHSHSMANGQMQMRKIDNFSIAARGESVFRPGEQHIMLIGLKEPLKENTTVTVEMCFEEICSVIKMPVVSVLNESKLPEAGQHQH